MSDPNTSETPVEMTIEEYERLPESDEYKDELVRGVVVREPRPGPYHGRTQARLSRELLNFVDRHAPRGDVFTDVGVVISRRLRTVRGPDVAYYGPERLPDPLPSKGFLEVAPDLAAEIVSPSNTAADILERVSEYLKAGSRIVWVVDPRARTATVYHAQGRITVLGEHDTLDGDDVLPGFRVLLKDVLP